MLLLFWKGASQWVCFYNERKWILGNSKQLPGYYIRDCYRKHQRPFRNLKFLFFKGCVEKIFLKEGKKKPLGKLTNPVQHTTSRVNPRKSLTYTQPEWVSITAGDVPWRHPEMISWLIFILSSEHWTHNIDAEYLIDRRSTPLLLSSSITSTATTATLPGCSAGAQSRRTGINTLICQHPLLNNPFKWSILWHSLGAW